MKKLSISKIAKIGILGAIAYILMLFKFPIPFLPPFMDFDFSGLVEIIATFTLGPVSGVFVVLIKLLLKLLFMGSSSALTGEVQNFLLSCAYILPAGLIYNRSKSRTSALVGTIVGTIVCAIASIFTNLYIILPLYNVIYGLSMENIIGMVSAVNSLVDSVFTFVLLGVVPFNIIKCSASSIIVYLFYPKLKVIVESEEQYAVQ